MRDYRQTQRLYDHSGGHLLAVRRTRLAVNLNLGAEAGGKVTLVQEQAGVKRGQEGAFTRYMFNSCSRPIHRGYRPKTHIKSAVMATEKGVRHV